MAERSRTVKQIQMDAERDARRGAEEARRRVPQVPSVPGAHISEVEKVPDEKFFAHRPHQPIVPEKKAQRVIRNAVVQEDPYLVGEDDPIQGANPVESDKPNELSDLRGFLARQREAISQMGSPPVERPKSKNTMSLQERLAAQRAAIKR